MNTTASPAAGNDHLKAVALSTFFNIAKLWQLNENQEKILLSNPPEVIFKEWKSGGNTGDVDHQLLLRLSLIVGIFELLQRFFQDQNAADTWISKPNSAPLFGGKSALDFLLKSDTEDINRVRQYLASQCI